MHRDMARQYVRGHWRDYAQKNLEPAKQKVNRETSYVCPFCGHGSNGDGLTYNPQGKDGNLKCFGCNWNGDVIDLFMKLHGVDYDTALKELAAQMGITVDPYKPTAADDFRDRPETHQNAQEGALSGTTDNSTQSADNAQNAPTTPTADYTEYYKACRERLSDPRAVDYLTGRGISIETATACGIGFDPEADPANAPGAMGNEHKPHPTPRIIIPTSRGHYVGRSIDPNTPSNFRKMNSRGSTPNIFNPDSLFNGTGTVFVTEGAFDALSFCEAGAGAIALNSKGNGRLLLNLLNERKTDAILILCLDNDGKTAKETAELRNGLTRIGVPCLDMGAVLCGQYKDPNDRLQADRAGFIKAVEHTIATAGDRIDEERDRLQREEEERQERTGAGMVDAFLQEISTRRYEPTPTGIPEIDRAIGGGLIRQQLILLGAAPGAGKTALAQWMFESMAQRGKACIYLNLEMSREQMLARSLSRLTAQNGRKITPTEILQGYRWTQEQREIITRAAEQYKIQIAPRMIYNPDGVTANLDSILQYLNAEAQRAKAAGTETPLVVLDYLQIIRGNDREDDVATIKRAVENLKRFAIEQNTLVFVIMAHNRASNQSGKVTMESGRDTSALEYSADLQMGLTYTRTVEKPGQQKKNTGDLTAEDRRYITLTVTKNRFGAIGEDVDLYFNGEAMTFSTAAVDFTPEESTQQRKAGRKLS